MSNFPKVLQTLWRTVAGDGTSDEHANEPDYATTSPHELSSPSLVPAQPLAQRTNDPIDLTSDESESANRSAIKIYEDDIPLPKTSPLLHRRVGDGERQSMKEHTLRKPSGATRAPDPARGYQGPTTKPGASNAFRPVNTFPKSNSIAMGHNPAYGHKKTYARHDRNPRLIGQQRHPGQIAFIERHFQQPHTTGFDDGSPAKRRKIAQPDDGTAVEIEDSEDEIQRDHPAPRHASTPRAHSIVSSPSPRSTASRQSGTESQPTSGPISEFQQTSDILRPRRAKQPRRKTGIANNEIRRTFNVNVPTLEAGISSRRPSVELVGNVKDSKHTGIGRLEGGGDCPTKDRSQSNSTTDRVTSHHFDSNKMRINESTAQGDFDRIINGRPARPSSSKNLRDFRPAGCVPSEVKGDPIEPSEDELTSSNTSKPRRGPTIPKNKQQGRDVIGREYKLSHARTYDTEPGSTDLWLSQTENSDRHFSIRGTDINGKKKILHQLNFNSINQVQTDNVQCMRLLGAKKNGAQYWYDLAFEDVEDFEHFRDNVVYQNVPKSSRHMKDSNYMKMLFKNPMKRNDKIEQTPTQSEVRPLAPPSARQQVQSTKPLLEAFMEKPRNTHNSISSSVDVLRLPGTQAQARSTRSTRATAPAYDKDFFDDEKEVVKFSKTGKLGDPWPNHLDFSVQESFLKRRKCTVNFDDLPKLDEEEFLNDSLVNFYLLYLYNELKVSIDRVYFFNTYFFDTLTKNTKRGEAINYDAVKSWTKRDDVFSYDHIVVPINEKFHWYLAIICNVSNIPRKPAGESSEEDPQNIDQRVISHPLLAPTAGSENDVSIDTLNEANDTTPVQEVLVDKNPEDDEENLFEEEMKLSLIDRDEENMSGDQLSMDVQVLSNGQTYQEANTTEALNSAQAADNIAEPLQPKPKQLARKKKPGGPKKDPEKPTIVVLDSLGSMHSNATRALREWLQAEGLEKRGMTVEMDNKGYYAKHTHVPMQSNFSDCGLYVLGYARKFFADPEAFKNKLLSGEMSSQADWPDMDASKMREDIRDLILRLYNEQEAAKREARKAKKAARRKDALPEPGMGEDKVSSIVEQPTVVDTQVAVPAPPVPHTEPQQGASPSENEVITPAADRRLGYPFKMDRTNRDQSNTPPDVEEDVASVTVPVSSPQQAITSSKFARPKGSPVRRNKSPEVRVSKVLNIDTGSYVPYDGATDRWRDRPQRATDLSSPPREHKMHSLNDEKPRVPSAQKISAKSPSRRSVERRALSPLRSRTRSGSHDDPIPLDDSQDLDAPVHRQARASKALVSEVIELDRSQEDILSPVRSKSPPSRNVGQTRFERDDSIQEMFGCEWEGRQIRSDTVKAPSADHRVVRGDATASEFNVPWDSQDESSKPQSQSSLTIEVSESQPMDVDGDEAEVPESPEPRTSSPGPEPEAMEWQRTRAL